MVENEKGKWNNLFLHFPPLGAVLLKVFCLKRKSLFINVESLCLHVELPCLSIFLLRRQILISVSHLNKFSRAICRIRVNYGDLKNLNNLNDDDNHNDADETWAVIGMMERSRATLCRVPTILLQREPNLMICSDHKKQADYFEEKKAEQLFVGIQSQCRNLKPKLMLIMTMFLSDPYRSDLEEAFSLSHNPRNLIA